jgi:CRP-like cAMP-binding protein
MCPTHDIPLLRQLNPTDRDRIIASLKPKSFCKGEHVILPGETQHELYFVQRGVQMAYMDCAAKTQVVAFAYPPDWWAIPGSFALQVPSRYSVMCLLDSDVLYLTFDELQCLFDQSQAIERFFRLQTEGALARLVNRQFDLLTLSMGERYRAFCKRSPHLLQLIPHKYIASYLGIDPTNFSKLFNQVRI